MKRRHATRYIAGLICAGLAFTAHLSSATAQALPSPQHPALSDTLTATRLADVDHQVQILREALASEQHKSAHTKNHVAALGLLAGAGIIAAALVDDADDRDPDHQRVRLIRVVIGAGCILVAINALIPG